MKLYEIKDCFKPGVGNVEKFNLQNCFFPQKNHKVALQQGICAKYMDSLNCTNSNSTTTVIYLTVLRCASFIIGKQIESLIWLYS